MNRKSYLAFFTKNGKQFSVREVIRPFQSWADVTDARNAQLRHAL